MVLNKQHVPYTISETLLINNFCTICSISINSKDVTLKSTGKVQTIYYFSKDSRSTGCDLPAGKVVVENSKTGLPMLKNG